MAEYAVQEAWNDQTSSEDSSTPESVVLGVLDGDTGEASNTFSIAKPSRALDGSAPAPSKAPQPTTYPDNGTASLFSPDSVFNLFPGFGRGSLDGLDTATEQHEEWSASDAYLAAKFDSLGLDSDADFQRYRSRPNGVSLVDDEPSPFHQGSTVQRSEYGFASDTTVDPSSAATFMTQYPEFTLHPGEEHPQLLGARRFDNERENGHPGQPAASSWPGAGIPVEAASSEEIPGEPFVSLQGSAPPFQPLQYAGYAASPADSSVQYRPGSVPLPGPAMPYGQLKRNVTIETQAPSASAHEPVQVHRSSSMDQIFDEHHGWNGSQHAPPMRLAHSFGNMQNVGYGEPVPPNRPPALHVVPPAYNPLGPMPQMGMGSPTGASLRSSGRSHSPTYMQHSSGMRTMPGYGPSRGTSPLSSPRAAAAAAANAAQNGHLIMGVRVPTTVLLPGVGYRVVDMVVSPSSVPFNGAVLRQPPYDHMLGSPTAAGQEGRHRNKDPVRTGREAEAKDIASESADGYIYQVQFKRAHRNFILGPSAPRNIKAGDYVKVEADRGEDLGLVVGKVAASDFSDEKHTAGFKGRGFSYHQNEAKRIIRLATAEEQVQLAVKHGEEEKVLQVCREKVENRSLPMKVIDAEYQYDRHKLTFFFEADRRIDFRELVRDLFALYKTRIWLQQVDSSNAESGRLPDQTDLLAESVDADPRDRHSGEHLEERRSSSSARQSA